MLPILLLIVWLAVMALFVAICRMAAHGDAQPAPDATRPARTIGAGLVVWEEEQPSTRPHAGRWHVAHWRPTARGVRTHSAR